MVKTKRKYTRRNGGSSPQDLYHLYSDFIDVLSEEVESINVNSSSSEKSTARSRIINSFQSLPPELKALVQQSIRIPQDINFSSQASIEDTYRKVYSFVAGHH